MITWTLYWTEKALEMLSKLDPPIQKRIKKYMLSVAECGDPFSRGHGLIGNETGKWRYRVGKYRVICEIKNATVTINVIEIGSRDKIYR